MSNYIVFSLSLFNNLLENPPIPRLLLVIPADYPHFVLKNYLSYCLPLKINIESLNQAKNITVFKNIIQQH